MLGFEIVGSQGIGNRVRVKSLSLTTMETPSPISQRQGEGVDIDAGADNGLCNNERLKLGS
jgi:hypothetical protein